MPAASPACWLIPPAASLATGLASLLRDTCGPAARDFSHHHILVPSFALGQSLGHVLQLQCGGPVLMPALHTPQSLAEAYATVPAISGLQVQLRLTQAVTPHSRLFPGQTPLAVAQSLASLFAELDSLGAHWDVRTLPDRLRALYAPDSEDARAQAWLSREAEIVSVLYRAWVDELGAARPSLQLHQGLANALADWPADTPLWVVGFDALAPAWIPALKALLSRGDLRVVLHAPPSGMGSGAAMTIADALGLRPQVIPADDSPRRLLLQAVFEQPGIAYQRLLALPAHAAPDGLSLLPADDPEHEALCVDHLIRAALHPSPQRVVVVSEDRRLARRLRARLERAGLSLADGGGWALSTSRAATVLDAWLRCVEEDFPLQALLALHDGDWLPMAEDHKQALMQLAERHQLDGGWRMFRRHAVGKLAEHLDTLQQERQRLRPLLQSVGPADARIAMITATLEALGVAERFAADEAGNRLLHTLLELQTSFAAIALQAPWPELQSLIAHALESASFTLAGDGAVRLVTMAQTLGLQADVVIVAGATQALLAAPPTAPVFNDGVRRELGLSTASHHLAIAHAQLLRLLECAPRVILSYAPGEAGEAGLLAPPLALLREFAEAAGRPLPLESTALAQAHWDDLVSEGHALPAPTCAPQVFASARHQAVIASRLSARAHQSLIDCPYAFHLRYALGLEGVEEPDAEEDNRALGEVLHVVLEAFSVQKPGFSAPYAGSLSDQGAIIAHLEVLVRQALGAETVPSARRVAWQARLTANLALLADWLMQDAVGRTELALEAPLSKRLSDAITLKGRVDRLATGSFGTRVSDYKLGYHPDPKTIYAGEDVQLAHYAELADATHAEFWVLKDQEILTLDPVKLAATRTSNAQRLHDVAAAIGEAARLPAHADAATCERCDLWGVCRWPAWERKA